LIGVDAGSLIFSTLRYDGKYLLDFDPFHVESIPASSGASVVYELVPTSSVTENASIQLKVWTSTVRSHSYKIGEFIAMRQEICSMDTTHSVYVSDSFLSMSQVVVGGVDYYPSVSLLYVWTPFMDDSTPLSTGTVLPGASSSFIAVDGGDRGLSYSSFSWSVSWFYDVNRSMPVATPPSGLPNLSGYILGKHIFTGGLNFLHDGALLSSGVASYGTVPRGGNAPTIEMAYVRSSDLSVALSTVKFKSNGMPDQIGNDTSIYLVPG
jgi:hypothetical protein